MIPAPNDIAKQGDWHRAIRLNVCRVDPITPVAEEPREMTPRESAAITAISCVAIVLIVGTILGWF